MTPEHDKELCELCPNLYADRAASMQETCMCWGFECGDGWFELIKDLSVELESLILKLPKGKRKNYKASQVKEKFGTLRFYMTSETEEMSSALHKAENRSSHVCETCGIAGKLYTNGWCYVACDEHTKKKDLPTSEAV